MLRTITRKQVIKRMCMFSLLIYAISLLFLTSCTVVLPYSILNPAGIFASNIAWLTWLMIIVYGVVFLITIAILIAALIVHKQERSILGTRFIVVSGIVLPIIILTTMLIFELRISKKVSPHHIKEDLTVQVIGHGWWFEVRYPSYAVVDANEIHVPIRKVVRYELWSSGMIHSFWIPRLGGKRDQNPDHTTSLYLIADTPGIYNGVCAEYCAGQHARMEFRVVAHTDDDFNNWIEQSRQVQANPHRTNHETGVHVFLNGGCHSCHTIKGLSGGNTGPDLTLLGSRLTLGAGQFDNSEGTLGGWIANSQALKPGNLMPRTYLFPDSLHDLVQFLRGLK